MRWRDVKQNRLPKERKETINEEQKPKYHYASLGDRFKAFVTDSFLLSMPIFYIVIYVVMNGREGFSHHMLLGWAYILLPLAIIVVLFYFLSGQTPGLKAYELKVIDHQSGEKPGVVLAFLRFFFFNMVFFSVIGLFFPLFRKDRRALHDILSGTSVISLKEK